MVTLKQTQTGEPFLDPVPIEVSTADFSNKIGTTRRFLIKPTGKLTTAQFPFDGHEVPRALRVDPDGTLLKELVVK